MRSRHELVAKSSGSILLVGGMSAYTVLRMYEALWLRKIELNVNELFYYDRIQWGVSWRTFFLFFLKFLLIPMERYRMWATWSFSCEPVKNDFCSPKLSSRRNNCRRSLLLICLFLSTTCFMFSDDKTPRTNELETCLNRVPQSMNY